MSKCNSCIFRMHNNPSGQKICCDYLLLAGKMRGCLPDQACIRYMKSTAKLERLLQRNKKMPNPLERFVYEGDPIPTPIPKRKE